MEGKSTCCIDHSRWAHAVSASENISCSTLLSITSLPEDNSKSNSLQSTTLMTLFFLYIRPVFFSSLSRTSAPKPIIFSRNNIVKNSVIKLNFQQNQVKHLNNMLYLKCTFLYIRSVFCNDKWGYIGRCVSMDDPESNKHKSIHTSIITGILFSITIHHFSLLVKKQTFTRRIGQHQWMHSIEVSQSS